VETVDESGRVVRLEPSLDASDLADAFVEQACGRGLGAFAA
jgi:hypothetical protein